jgi:hypothetical protein
MNRPLRCAAPILSKDVSVVKREATYLGIVGRSTSVVVAVAVFEDGQIKMLFDDFVEGIFERTFDDLVGTAAKAAPDFQSYSTFRTRCTHLFT